jgi:hypothetical protein
MLRTQSCAGNGFSSRPWRVRSVVLIAARGIILYYFSSRLALSTATVGGVIVLLIVKHLGLLSPLYALLGKARRWL